MPIVMAGSYVKKIVFYWDVVAVPQWQWWWRWVVLVPQRWCIVIFIFALFLARMIKLFIQQLHGCCLIRSAIISFFIFSLICDGCMYLLWFCLAMYVFRYSMVIVISKQTGKEHPKWHVRDRIKRHELVKKISREGRNLGLNDLCYW